MTENKQMRWVTNNNRFRQLSILGLLMVGWLFLVGFTPVDYQPGVLIYGDSSSIDTSTQDYMTQSYQYVKETHGVEMLTIVDPTYTEEDELTGITQLMNQWKPSKTAILIVNPEQQVADIGVTPDIMRSLSELTTYKNRINQFAKQGQMNQGIQEFYNYFTYENIQVDSAVDTQNHEYVAETVTGVRTINDFDTSEVGRLGMMDIIVISVMGVAILGVIGYGIKRSNDVKRLKRDIQTYKKFARVNPAYKPSDIWGQLYEDGEVATTYQEYKDYMAKNLADENAQQNK